jgi:hypothetical protein
LDQFYSFPFLDAEEFYRFDLCAEHDPWLESGDGAALRTLLAGLIGIATSFGCEEDESPPSAASAEDFRAHVRPRRKLREWGGSAFDLLQKLAANFSGGWGSRWLVLR